MLFKPPGTIKQAQNEASKMLHAEVVTVTPSESEQKIPSPLFKSSCVVGVAYIDWNLLAILSNKTRDFKEEIVVYCDSGYLIIKSSIQSWEDRFRLQKRKMLEEFLDILGWKRNTYNFVIVRRGAF